MGTIEHIFIAPRKGAAATAVTSVAAIADCGLEGDRYASAGNRKNHGQQVTLIEAEQIERFVDETGLALAPQDSRRNLVTRGIDLNSLVGQRFAAGESELEGIELCEPCSRWARSTHWEVVRFFSHRGGLNARIVRGGTIAVGSPVFRASATGP